MSGADDSVDTGAVDGEERAREADAAAREKDGASSDDDIAGETGADSSTTPDLADGGLVSRLQLIEERPLPDRAEAYGRIHGELVDALEGGDRPELDD